MADQDKVDHAMKDISDMVEKLPSVIELNSPRDREAGEQDATHPQQNTKVAILSTKTRLAELILTLSNSEDLHSTPGDALWKHAWIVKGKHLALIMVNAYQ